MPQRRKPTSSREPQPAQRFEIRVRGPLGPTLLEAFPTLTADRQGQDTLLRGVLPDQNALYGVLYQIEALGLHLVEVRTVGAEVRARAKSQGPCEDASLGPE